MAAVDIVQKLWGTKHPEGRELTESVYRELVQNLLIKENPLHMELKLDQRKTLPDIQFVQDARINPVLVKKTELNLPSTIRPLSSSNPMLRSSSTGSRIFNNIEK